MHMAHDFLLNLALALGVAGVAAAVFQRLRQPAVLGYLVAGILVGPHVPVPLFADAEIVGALSELGVILLMFSIGLEFPLRTVPKVAGAGGLVALIEVGALAWLGGLVGLAFGWSPAERLFAGAMVAISSTSLIARLFEDRGETGPHRDLVFGVLIVEDLIAILLLTVLATLGSGGELHLGSAGLRLGGIVLGLMAGGLLIVPRLVRALDRSRSDEVLSVGVIGVCFGMALLAAQLGASVALGAFLAGTLAAESGLGHKLQGLLRGVRDVFGALFFVSVGMLFDPALVWAHAPAVLALFAVVIVGKVIGVSAGAFLVGSGLRDSARAGFSMANIGEFSFILAGLGLSSGATRGFLLPVAVAVSVLTAFVSPHLARLADPAAAALDRALPRPLQTLSALYTAWVEQLRTSGAPTSLGHQLRRLAGLALLDAAAFVALVAANHRYGPELAAWMAARVALPDVALRWGLIGVALVLAAPLLTGLALTARRAGLLLSDALLAGPEDGGPRTPAVRRLVQRLVQTLALLALGLPIMALTQPFLPPAQIGALLVALQTALAVLVWRQARSLQGEIGAGAGLLARALLGRASPDEPHTGHAEAPTPLAALGEPVGVRLRADSPAVGRTLVELNLRAVTGATVLAIHDASGAARVPDGRRPLEAGELLMLAGPRAAEDAAARLLLGPEGAR